jgi:hypothetical protein
MRVIQRTFVNFDGTRKVEIFQRDDKTFGFEEMRFGSDEKTWFPAGKYSIAVIDSLENTIREATERVEWMRSRKTV